MAIECRQLILTINLMKQNINKYSSMINQLDHLSYVSVFLEELEKHDLENGISTQLRPLFLEASKVLGTLTAKNITKRLLARKATRSSSQMISEALQKVKPKNIAERILASKPSRSSSQITMDTVNFVNAVLDCTASCPYRFPGLRVDELDYVPRVLVLQKKLRYLQVLLHLTAEQCIEHESMKGFFTHIEDVAYAAAHLCFLGLAYTMDSKFSELLESISPFRPELRKIYMNVLTGLKSSRSEAVLYPGDMLGFITALQEDLKVLLRCGYGIPWLKQGFSCLSKFLGDTSWNDIQLGELSSLYSHMEALVIEAAIAIYSFDEEMDDTTEVDRLLFHLQLKFNRVKVDMDLIQLLNRQATITVPLVDLTAYVSGELILLETSFMGAFELYREHTHITDFLTFTQSVTNQAWSIINSLSHDLEQEDLARKIICLHFQLLLKFKFIKAVIREKWPSISATSTLDHPNINLLNFLPIGFEVIDSYLSMVKSSDIPTIDELLMRFHGYILNNLLLRDETYLTYTVATVVKKFYYGLMLLITYLQDPLVQCIDCKKQNDISTVFGTITIEAESAMCLSNEEVNLLLQFLTVAFRLIEAEGSLVDLLKHKSTLNAQVLDLIESAHEELIFLRAILLDLLRQHQELNKLPGLLMHAEVTAKKLAWISDSCHESFLDGSSPEKMRLLLSNLVHEIESVKVELRKACLPLLDASSLRNMTDGEGLIHFLLNQHGKNPNHDPGSFYESIMDGSNMEKTRLLLSDFQQEREPDEVEEVRKGCVEVVDISACEMRKTNGEGLISLLLTQQDSLPDYNAGSISFLDIQISAVKDKLLHMGSFLADIVQYRSMHLELKDLAERVQAKGYVCFFSVRGYRHIWYYTSYLSDVKQLLRFVEAEVQVICLKVPDSSTYIFPKTNGLGFLNCFLGKLEGLLHSKLDLISELKPQIGLVKEGLLCLRSSLDHLADSYDETCGLIASVTEMAYTTEYVIDSCLACSHPLWYKVLWICEVVENIKLVNKVVSETCERNKIYGILPKVTKTSTANLAPLFPADTPKENEEMEGFQDTLHELKKQLLGGSAWLDVISIVGMPGLGKTTIAKRIYNDPVVTSHFDVRAQCLVTQLYSWRDLLLTILNDVLEPADRNEKEDGELADELRRFLLTKRFLILIDDVWDNKVWDNLQMCFEDARNGSRIILTTRLSDVANYVKCESDPHHLRLFRDDESWTLLQKQVFQGERCPPELGDVGYRIAKSCKGLPLSIVLVAGVLKQKKKKPDLWKIVEQSLGSQNIGSLQDSMSIIGFSYKNLPHQLKPCFLYFGGFLRGKDIHVSKLTRLWVAEGFVQANKKKGPVDAAEDFLEDLIRRNLVMRMEKRPNAKVKTCRIHDLLHKFCVEKAKEENFLLQINSGGAVLPEQPKEYRLFVHSYQDEIDLWRPSRSNIRSLLFNSIDLDNLLWPRDISFMFSSFNLLKVLDLESFNIGGIFPSEIQYLIQMRYFAAQSDANSIPSSIAKLWNLETFVVRGLGGEIILPFSLLKMVKLRHLHVNHRVSFGLHENMHESHANSQLANLETFSTPRLSYGEDGEKILRKMPKLRKLSCIFSGTFGYSRKVMGRCVLFPRLDFLNHLESLKLVSNNYPAKLHHEFNFPLKLRELTLSKFRLPWTQVLTIAELPKLEILKLHLRAFEGDRWEVRDSDFPELKYLKLDNLNVRQWCVSDDAFPKLECLVLIKCKRLEKIPSHFDDAISLKSIEVKWCSWSVANSAQEIQKMQHEDMANAAFTVTIQPPDWARKSSP